MKKLYIILLALAVSVYTFGQSTITIYPDKDAMIYYSANPSSSNSDNNYGSYVFVNSLDWTVSGYQATIRSMMDIDLSQLPAGAVIQEAKLYLYGTGGHYTNLTTGSSSYKTNASYLRRIIEPWEENVVTWNTKPNVTTLHQASLGNSATSDQDYVVDVTDLIQDMVYDPDNSHGLMLQLQAEDYYTEMRFASSDNADANLHPKLVVSYMVPSLPDLESFEFSNTKWENVDGDDTEWVRDAHGTTSTATGPTEAIHGKYYAYIESSSPNYPSKKAYLESPRYFMDDYENVSIHFDYHMYGATMGSLSLQIMDENDEIWDEIWSVSGDKGNVWNSTQIDVSSLIPDKNFYFRFIGTTGSSYTSDIALDNIQIKASKKSNLSSSQNYIHTVSPMTADGLSGMTQQGVQYFDGLGRLKQEVSVGGTPEGRDIVAPVGYDDVGRQDKNYLPFPEGLGDGGSYRSEAIDEQESFYQDHFDLGIDDPFAYAQTVFEASPLNRVLKVGSPGKDFSPIEETGFATEHVREFDYSSNATGEVRYFSVDANGNLANSPTHYTPNTLYNNTIYDEDGNATKEFKDLEGRVVLKRSFDGIDSLSTYYVYDDFGLLRFVIPPKAMGDNGIPDSFKLYHLCYQYTYDERKRMVEKKLPGVEPVFMVYDRRDRLAATQDGNMRADSTKEWLYTKYDCLNRPVQTGLLITSSTKDQSQMQTLVYEINDDRSMYEERDASKQKGYTEQSFPVFFDGQFSSIDIYSITYYDNYDHLSLSWYTGSDFDAVNNIDTYQEDNGTAGNYNTLVKGQVTGSATLVLDDTNTSWVFSSNFYDEKYRAIQTQSTLYPSGTSMSSNKYDFVGTVLESLEMQTVNNVTNQVHYFFTYDHALRPLKTSVMVNGDDAVLLSENRYNELGELIEKNLHSTDNSTYTQSVDYTYNMRGWLTAINDPDDFVTDPSDLFAMSLFYNEDADINNTGLYNGNISAIQWARDANTMQGYKYSYDEMNRLLSADYQQKSGATWSNPNNYDTDYSYDYNGNIEEIFRYDDAGTLADILTLEYAGKNQLYYVDDDGTQDLYEDESSSQYFAYDQNGNMTRHEDKQVTVDYNYLNLPKKVQTQDASGDKIEYIYDASGVKWLKKVDNGAMDNTAYCGAFVYKDAGGSGTYSMDYLLTAEGRVDFDGSGGKNYRYTLKDHLGNTRVEFDAAMANNQDVDYYPFGMSFTTNMGGDNKYLYNNKEIQDELLGGVNLDWYDYGARFYDPALGRFHTIDPMTVFTPGISPYSYADDNPINNIDYYGLGPIGDFFRNIKWPWNSMKVKREKDQRKQAAKSRRKGRKHRTRTAAIKPQKGGIYNPNIATIAIHGDGLKRARPFDDNIVFDPLDFGFAADNSKPIVFDGPVPEYKGHIIEDDNVFTFSEIIRFPEKSNQYDIAATEKTLSDLVKTLVDYPQLQIRIYGNAWSNNVDGATNDQAVWDRSSEINGSPSTLGGLASARAKAIMRYLENKGISSNRIRAWRGNVYPDSRGLSTSFELINQ